ncbi:MAG: GWxTD domain-containing protein [bacterium]|nr:GWxTD domain-containing protein [bacterium]
MMRVLFLASLCAAFLALSGGTAYGALERNFDLSRGGGPQFQCQLGQRLGTEADSIRLVAASAVPYDHLVFLRTDSGFTASFELVTSVLRDGTGLFAERITRQEVSTDVYAETNSRVKNVVHVDQFLVPPGDYSVRVTLTADKRTRRKSKWEGKISLAASDPLLRVSDIYWISEDTTSTTLGLPRVTETFATDEQDAVARVQVFSTGREDLRLAWTVLGEKGDTVRSDVTRITPDGTIQTHEYVVPIEELPAYPYRLRLEAEGNGRREVRTREFSVRIPGIPASITDIDLAVRQLKYIATSDENRRLREALPEEKERLFKEFWRRRDPDDGMAKMEEYYYRVEYANEQFSTHRVGWETDRGRIYILYGEPTDIERHPFEAGTRPYEIWFYASPSRRFVFVDYTGFGDYTLVSPEWGY